MDLEQSGHDLHLDVNGNVLLANAAAHRLFGVEQDSLQGQPIAAFFSGRDSSHSCSGNARLSCGNGVPRAEAGRRIVPDASLVFHLSD
jgi:transcriptional regulator of aromatic amino acid metabolism